MCAETTGQGLEAGNLPIENCCTDLGNEMTGQGAEAGDADQAGRAAEGHRADGEDHAGGGGHGGQADRPAPTGMPC